MELVFVVLAVAVGALIKSVTGMGLPLLAIPVLAQVIGVHDAVLVMAPPTLASNVLLVWRYRPALPRVPNLPVLLATNVVGAVAGVWLFEQVDERRLSMVLAIAVLVYVVKLLTDPDVRLGARLARVLAAPVGLLAGVLQGATGISGPVVTTYVHAQRPPRDEFVAAVTAMFFVSALAQSVTLLGAGSYTLTLASYAAIATAAVLVVMTVGLRLAERLSFRWFDRLVLFVLLISGAKLFVDGLAG